MNATKKLDIRDAITACSYPLSIREQFISFLESNYGSQKHRLYLFSRNANSPKLFLLQLQIPAIFNNNTYDISLLVYFPLNFPSIEPEIFFQRKGQVKINPNCLVYIDEETLKINYSLFFEWKKAIGTFKELIRELRNQFNISFPIFNYPNKDNKLTNGDCVLNLNLCQEIELKNNTIKKNPVIQSQKSNNIKKNDNQEIINDNKDQDIQPAPLSKTAKIVPKKMDFDKNSAKLTIKAVLVSDLFPKICSAKNSLVETRYKIQKLKTDIDKKMSQFSVIDKSNDIQKTIDSIRKEFQNGEYDLVTPEGIEKIDYGNLDSLLVIKDKEFYQSLAKEKAIDEYIMLAKKSFEKQLIDFNTTVNIIRKNAKNIFALKYKNLHPKGI